MQLQDCRGQWSGRPCVGGIAKWRWREAEVGVVWKWELHTGNEVEAMQQHTGTVEQEVELVEWAWCGGRSTL